MRAIVDIEDKAQQPTGFFRLQLDARRAGRGDARRAVDQPAPAALPDQLAVVQVQAGETLQQLAGRVAPDAPAAQVMQRIRELNKLDSAALDAGQTLIAPLG